MGLRRLIRYLRGSKTPAATGWIDFLAGPERTRGRVVGPAGLRLIVSATVDGVWTHRIIGAADATDRDAFWREWRAAGGGPFYDETGAELDPEKILQ